MNYITYHEWCKHLRDATVVDRSAGKLPRIAAQSGIPLDRLERWLNKTLNLSHAEFISLHEVLATTHVLGSESSAADAADKEPGGASDPHRAQQCGCQSCEDNNLSFDQSN